MAGSRGVSRKAHAAAMRAVERERGALRRQTIKQAKEAGRTAKLLAPSLKMKEVPPKLFAHAKSIHRLISQRPPKRLRKV